MKGKRIVILLALAAVLAALLSVQAAWAAKPPDPPPSTVTIDQVTAKTVNEGQTLTFIVTASTTATNNPYNNLRFQTSNMPGTNNPPVATLATLTPSGQGQSSSRSATFSWTPTYTQAGAYQNITITALDGNNASASTTFSITVGNTNQPPVLNPIANPTVNEGQSLTFDISGTDPDGVYNAQTNPYGNILTFSASGLPTGAGFYGQTFSWTPEFNQAGNYNVIFKVEDNGNPKLSESKTVTITVGDVNRPPVFDPMGNQIINAGEPFSFTVTGSDPDNDTFTFSASNLPTGATFNNPVDPVANTLIWTPGDDQAGTHPVTFTITDTGSPSISVSQTINITVNANRPPVLDPIGNKTTAEGQLLEFTVTASDPDKDPLTFSIGGNPPKGATFDTATGKFSWTPDYDQAGEYQNIIFSVGDGKHSVFETITITVGNVNRAPVFTSDLNPKKVLENHNLNFLVTGQDPDGDTITFTAEGLPAGATFEGGTFNWTPSYYQAGQYPVTFYVQDGGSPIGQAQQTVTITVGNVNQAPVFTPIGTVPAAKEGQAVSFTLNAIDPDNDKFDYSCSPLPAGANFDAPTGKFSWTPNYGQAGTYTIIFYATDNGFTDGSSDPQKGETSVVISVNQPSPHELIESIIAYIMSLHLDKNVENSYIANLKKVDGFIAKGQMTPAINQLNATIQKVNQDLKKSGLIIIADANQIILMTNELLSMLTK